MDNVGNPRVVNPRVSPLPNPILNGNRLDFLEQITVPDPPPPPVSQVGVVYCGDNHPKPGTSWSSAVANTMSAIDGGVGSKSIPSPNRMKLEYIPPSIVNDRIVVSPPVEVEELGHPKWQRCIVGHFLDKKLAFAAVQHIAMKIWAKFGIREVFGHGDANCPLKVKEMAKETKKATGTNGRNGVVDTNTWQVVGSLRKDDVPGVELRSPVSLQAAIASTSDTGAVMPASISTRTESGIAVSTSPAKNAPPVLVSAEIGKQPVFMSSGDKAISMPSKFAILDAIGLNMEVGSVPEATALPVATGDGLPDEVTVECAMLDMELVSDFTVVPQSPATPIPVPDGKKGGGKGGGNVPAKGGGGKGGRKNKR
ncbi:hypothetical protein RHMOL_Rhmol02G0134500 [Rhododendron molle]|uniref:Uncharacterized protein n=1 Tax=Rhododendron molle TaxID=49168 RepID=A0ACC0PPI7_RHOML|nr:hypothetical protein RHMOL_Rhmol02G0134500 [Rhododendron molle]